VLPYLFGAELWPNNIRSFGAALSQMFHWLFYFAVNKGVPSMLSSMDNWGTFRRTMLADDGESEDLKTPNGRWC
jgi:hypothetical protein